MTEPRILLAEDDDDLRLELQEELTERGATVHEATDGVQLSRLLCQEGPFDLVISDVRMSWASGAQVLAMARMAGNQTPFIIITGFVDEQLKDSVERLGGVFLYKPFEIERLIEAAEQLLGRALGPLASPAWPTMLDPAQKRMQ